MIVHVCMYGIFDYVLILMTADPPVRPGFDIQHMYLNGMLCFSLCITILINLYIESRDLTYFIDEFRLLFVVVFILCGVMCCEKLGVWVSTFNFMHTYAWTSHMCMYYYVCVHAWMCMIVQTYMYNDFFWWLMRPYGQNSIYNICICMSCCVVLYTRMHVRNICICIMYVYDNGMIVHTSSVPTHWKSIVF